MNNRTIRTPKGTELPILNLKGKDYLQVAHRLVWFREEHPNWAIETEFLKLEQNYALAKVMIKNAEGKIVSTAHQDCSKQDFADFIAKAETSAMGRALAAAGFGTQFAGADLDEDKRISDSPLERNNGGIHPQQPTEEDGILEPNSYKIPFGKFKQRSLEEVGIDDLRSYVLYLETKAKKDGKEIIGVVADFIARASEYIGAFENIPVEDEARV
jgi:hypothetical protein